jgi:hypothetical protein
MPGRWYLQATEHRALVVVVCDPKARLQPDVNAELAQQLGTEGVDRSTLYAIGARPQLPLEAGSNFARGLVGEREHADPFRVESALLDKEANPLDQAECLARAGAGEDQDRLGESLDGLALGVGREVWGIGRDRRYNRDDRVMSGKTRERSGQAPVVL